MFEQTLLPGPVRTRKAWSVLLSFAGQLALIGALVLLPLIVTERVPVGQFRHLFFAPSVPPGPPPKPPGIQVVSTSIEQIREKPFVQPTEIPVAVKEIIDPPEALQTTAVFRDPGPSVIGGMPVRGGIGGDQSITRFIPQPQTPVQTPTVTPTVKPREQPPVQVPVGGKVQEAKLTHKVIPVYPRMAVQTRTAGTVRLSAIIGTDGTVRELKVMSGHPLLVGAALEAVQQWRYAPTTLNGQPVEIITTIDVHFTLSR